MARFYPLSVVKPTHMLQLNAVMIEVDYEKGTGIVLRLDAVQADADNEIREGWARSFVSDPMSGPRQRIKRADLTRNNAKKVEAELVSVFIEIVKKNGPAWEALTAFTTKHGLQLADSPTSAIIATGR